MSAFLRTEIESLAEYTLAQHPYRIKLNQNENPFELADEIKQDILNRLLAQKWSRYPAFVPQTQLQALAAFIQWDPEGILIGNGSNELLQLIFMAGLERGRTVVISQPTFTLYGILARGLAANVCNVMMKKDLTFDVGQIISAAKENHAALIVLCSPNNPTGTFLPRADICRILDATDSLVILDEAYVHFAPESQLELLKKYDKLVVLQTFSKAMGAAGLRLGYGAMSPALARNLNKLKLPYNVNIFSLTAMEVFLERWSSIKAWIDVLKKERSLMHARLQEFKEVRVYPSAANFLLMETRRKPPAGIFAELLQRGILIRDVSSYPLLEHALRVSVGTPSENSAFIDALKEIL